MRLARGLAIALWAVFFWWLWLSGESARYVGPRTAWVVPFGAIALAVVAVSYLATIRGRPKVRATARDRLGIVAMIAPIIAVGLIPAPFLGALAVHRKDGARAVAILANGQKPADPGMALSVYDVAAASYSRDYATQRGVTVGRKAKLVGMVTGQHADGSFDISRFRIVCCAADAIPYTVRVNPAQPITTKQNSWVIAVGVLQKAGDGTFSILADHVASDKAPSNPYTS
jgi:uncharacterized repeat protein (TIGR03943 family)